MIKHVIKYFLNNRLVTILILLVLVGWGLINAPFNWHFSFLPRDPVSVDAIPDIGENQQIVATEWMGRSPRDIEDQVTYPLTTSLFGIPGVKTIRSTSMFGMSFIYIIFDEKTDFYWGRTRILEKLNSLPAGTLPVGVQPTLGPDATALGQIYWYTLEGRDPVTGKPAGGWTPQDLRSLQDYYVKYGLLSAEGVSEIASIGGFVREYQVDIDPDALRAYNVTVMDVMRAVKESNLDVGAETVELNKVEYLVRGLGYIKSLEDLELAVVAVRNNTPVRISDVAKVTFGPAPRRGGLDKGGVEAVGGVVVARYGSNPLHVINNVKKKIEEIQPGLPEMTLEDGSKSKVTIVPFYDRTGLIQETIGTLETALSHEILISIIVIIVLVLNLRASIVISSMLPVAVLMTFIAMKMFGVDANIVALSGIAIAIGVMVDIGVVFVENIIRHTEMPENEGAEGERLKTLILNAITEVAPAVTTALLTTVVSFLPVFFMEASEGKLFRPLAFTKTFALLAAFLLGMIVLPTISYLVLGHKIKKVRLTKYINYLLVIAGPLLMVLFKFWPAVAVSLIGLNNLLAPVLYPEKKRLRDFITYGITLSFATWFLATAWLPLGAEKSEFVNFLFVGSVIAVILTALSLFVRYYEPVLRWSLANKAKFMLIPAFTILFGITAWQGFGKVFGFVAKGFDMVSVDVRDTKLWQSAVESFPGIGNEFMPSLDEGSFLLMPTSMPHTGIEQNIKYVRDLDRQVDAIPEVEIVVGKWGRINSALDPAPVQMFENTINYRSEYILDEDGHRMKFKTDREDRFILTDGSTYDPNEDQFRIIPADSLIPHKRGNYFRQWRKSIKNPDDIWNEIVHATTLPGLTSAPKLQPIETRLIMLSTGMRAPMGLKVYGPDLNSIEEAGLLFEQALKDVPTISAPSVFYDRAVGAPYIEIDLNRPALARYGITIAMAQDVIEAAIGGMALTTTVEGRERYQVRVRYARELRDSPFEIEKILLSAMNGTQIPLGEVADIRYVRGAQMLRSENSFPVGYVIFDKIENRAEVEVVNDAKATLDYKLQNGELVLPKGVTYKFAGNYEQQERASKRLMLLVPISLLLVLMLLYFQFKTVIASMIHFSGVFVAFAGGFIMIWLYQKGWFLDFNLAGTNMRDLFQIGTINMSVAVWVGFIALFGIATDDGVLMGTYIHQVFELRSPSTVKEVREAVVEAGLKRARPAVMTTATTIIALLPVLTSTGKGADIMVPMAIPTFGGMIIQQMTMFMVPIFQSYWRESVVRKAAKNPVIEENDEKKI